MPPSILLGYATPLIRGLTFFPGRSPSAVVVTIFIALAVLVAASSTASAAAAIDSDPEPSVLSRAAAPSSSSQDTAGSGSTSSFPQHSTGTTFFLAIADIILLALAATFSGLTLAIMGLDTVSLEIVAASGTDPDRGYAAAILPIRRHGYELLCTLIFGNVMVNTLIAQVTDSLMQGWVATIASTLMITLMGEVLPEALMQAHALYVGSRSVLLVKLFMLIFWPISKPLAMFLDCALGTDPGQVYDRNELKNLIIKHASHEDESGVNQADVDLAVGAMGLNEKTVEQVLTPLSSVFMIDSNMRLSREAVVRIALTGHSRIPVYSGKRSNIIGMLHAKDLLVLNHESRTRACALCHFYHRRFLTVPSSTKLSSLLSYFQRGAHFAVVTGLRHTAYSAAGDDEHRAVLGIVTLQNIIEEMLQASLVDEYSIHSKTSGSRAPRHAQRVRLSITQLEACGRALQQALLPNTPTPTTTSVAMGYSNSANGIDGDDGGGMEHSHSVVAALASANASLDQNPDLLRDYCTGYLLEPEQGAQALSWHDGANLWVYPPPTQSASLNVTVVNFSMGMPTNSGGSGTGSDSDAGDNNTPLRGGIDGAGVSSNEGTTGNEAGSSSGVGGGGKTEPLVTYLVHGRLQVAPLKRNSGATAVSGGGGDNIIDGSIVAELGSGSLLNVEGLRNPDHQVDYAVRAVEESLVIQLRYRQFRDMVEELNNTTTSSDDTA